MSTPSVEQAQRDVDAAERSARAAWLQQLEVIVQALPAKVEAYARTIGESQSEVTLTLGAEGVRNVREELRAAAGGLASLLTSIGDTVRVEAQNGDVVRGTLHDMLNNRAEVVAIGNILRDAGYSVEQGGPGPRNLYDPGSAHLYSFVEQRDAALRMLEIARKEEERNTARALWS